MIVYDKEISKCQIQFPVPTSIGVIRRKHCCEPIVPCWPPLDILFRRRLILPCHWSVSKCKISSRIDVCKLAIQTSCVMSCKCLWNVKTTHLLISIETSIFCCKCCFLFVHLFHLCNKIVVIAFSFSFCVPNIYSQ
jgi:hypothetical protein